MPQMNPVEIAQGDGRPARVKRDGAIGVDDLNAHEGRDARTGGAVKREAIQARGWARRQVSINCAVSTAV